MNEVNKFHDEAMNLAEMAAVAKVKGNLEQANKLLRQAYENEAKAANLLMDVSSPEPTRSVLFRSAASLAIDCNEFREAEKLIATGLSSNPPPDIAEELRDLFERVNFHRHLNLRGVVLEEDELQMSIGGRSVGVGIALSEQLVMRIEDARKLIFRTIERLLSRPYREYGAARGAVREYGLFVSVPRAGSFAISLRVSRPKPLPGFEKELEFIHSSQIIDEIMSCLEFFSRSEEKELREKIPQEAYYRNFVGIAKNLAPDGIEIRQVGFTALHAGRERKISLTRPRGEIRLAAERKEELEAKAEGKFAAITGRLLLADARHSGRERIELVDDAGQAHNVIVPEGMMSDIVKPLWQERVRVTGFYKQRAIRLEDISRAPTD
ncbi:MAG: hypothetical protein DDT32_00140 [Syntrophomonadaceae bacterium]|nr:hypothetical protein [Bacillota bacterium]MBT9146414.1 hypothetical protein [Bacillota bacterium]